MMKILMILSNPFMADPRVHNEAKSLINAGHEVTVLGWDKKRENPSKEVKDGIHVIRSYNTKFMDLLPYDILRLHFWWNKGYRDAQKLCEKKSFDVIHCHNLDTLPIGLKLKRKLGIKLVYDAHEIWGYMVAKDLPGWWANYYLWKEKKLLKFVDHMIVTNPARKKFYKNKNIENITIIDNFKHLRSSEYISPPNQNEKKLYVLYVGALIKTRLLIELVKVVNDLENVELSIGGIGKLYEEIKKKSKDAENVNFMGIIPSEEVLPRTLENDVVFCMIAPYDKNDITASTNKQYEAMVCGRPIICAKGTYAGEATEKENVGLAIEYNIEALREAIIKLRDNPKLREKLGKNALKAALNKYNWEKQEEKLLEVYTPKTD